MHTLTSSQVATMLSNIMDRHNLRANYNADTMSVESVCLIQSAAYHIEEASLKGLYVFDDTKVMPPQTRSRWSCNEFYLEWPDQSIATVNGVSSFCDLRGARLEHARSQGCIDMVDHVTTVELSSIRSHSKEEAWWQEELCLQLAAQLSAATPVASHAKQVHRL